MPAPKQTWLFNLPEQFERITEQLALIDGWEELDPKKSTEEERARDAFELLTLTQKTQAELDQWMEDLQSQGHLYHDWLILLRQRAENNREVARSTQKLAQSAERTYDRIKSLVLDTMNRLGIGRLEGPGWRMRTQTNGGKPPIEQVSSERPPLRVLSPVPVEPDQLVWRFQEFLAYVPQDVVAHALAKMREQVNPLQRRDGLDTDAVQLYNDEHAAYDFLLGSQSYMIFPQVSTTRLWDYIEKTGTVPDMFEVQEKANHLRVE